MGFFDNTRSRAGLGDLLKRTAGRLQPGYETGMHPDQTAARRADTDEVYRQAQMSDWTEDNALAREKYEQEKAVLLAEQEYINKWRANDPNNPYQGIPASMIDASDIKDYEQGRLTAKRGFETAGGTYGNTVDSINQALGMVEGLDLYDEVTHGGIGGSILGAVVPSSDARLLDTHIDQIVSVSGFRELQAMRDASKTGGALGQVAVQELVMLQSTITKLKERGLSVQDKAKNLRKMKDSLDRWYTAQAKYAGEEARLMPTRARPEGESDCRSSRGCHRRRDHYLRQAERKPA